MLFGCGGGSSSGTSDTLVFGRGSDSVGLDPALETDGESFKVCDNLYETLVTYAPGHAAVLLRPTLLGAIRALAASDDPGDKTAADSARRTLFELDSAG
ncbi:MAG: hypothetical protein VYB08_09260, partial [Candidatus Latescibacterota bacterium]|nr:hypothetical protein [Candidatus Latescibacterota bacterium]